MGMRRRGILIYSRHNRNTAKYVSEKAQAVEKQASCEIHKS